MYRLIALSCSTDSRKNKAEIHVHTALAGGNLLLCNFPKGINVGKIKLFAFIFLMLK
jgi:hypothetical protein